MNNIIIAFKARSDSLKFSELLRKGGVPSTIINTPRELSVGCGLSVSVEQKYRDYALKALMAFDKTTYIGTYQLMKSGARTIAVAIR